MNERKKKKNDGKSLSLSLSLYWASHYIQKVVELKKVVGVITFWQATCTTYTHTHTNHILSPIRESYILPSHL